LDRTSKPDWTGLQNTSGTFRRFEYSNYFGNRDNRSWREPREKKDPDAIDIDAMSTEKRTLLMKKGLCFICEKPGHCASEHKDFETKRKDKDDVPILRGRKSENSTPIFRNYQRRKQRNFLPFRLETKRRIRMKKIQIFETKNCLYVSVS
jgi:hypothetical protein